MENKKLFGYNLLSTPLKTANFSEKCVINTLNVHSYAVAKKDKTFRKALLSSNILIPDGIGIVHAHKFINGARINKIAGFDVFEFLMKKAQLENKSCFFLGSSVKTLKLIENRIRLDYPNVRSGSFSPPFKKVFSSEDNSSMQRVINDFKPDILFVGMTAPKQEKWVHANKESLNTNIICSIGAVFDFYAGTIERPSKIWIDLGLEWFMRFLQNPKKMFPRVFVSTSIFLKDLLLEKLRAN